MNTGAPAVQLARIDAAALADGLGNFAAPASVLVELRAQPDAAGWHNRVLAVGRTADVLTHEANRSPQFRVVARPDAVLIPGLVNAHTHLDLTHLGPRPFDPSGGFVGWVDMIRAGRHADPDAIAASVAKGIELSLAAGTVAIGDIAGAPGGRPSLVPWQTIRRLGVRGVSYLEFFAIGAGLERGLKAIAAAVESAAAEARLPGARLGLQPHAPNTVDLTAYSTAISNARRTLGADAPLPLATHLAETPEEMEFIAHARGPQREMLERLGVWDDSTLARIGHGRSPIAHLAGVLKEAGQSLAAVHVNSADDADIETLARSETSVVYCPHASAYFAAERHFGPHQYREMLAAGINVALGTDSIVNLPVAPRSPLEPASLSLLAEARLLQARDGTDPVTLLKMATMNGAQALGLDQAPFTFQGDGPLAGLLAVQVQPSQAHQPQFARAAFEGVLTSVGEPEILFADTYCGLTGTIRARPV